MKANEKNKQQDNAQQPEVRNIRNLKNRKFTAYAAVLTVLALAIAIPINLIASRLDIHWDMTPQKLYELSDTTKDYLDKLDADGQVVDFYFLMDMDYLASDDDSMALHHMLDQFSKYDCINFVDFDPDERPELLTEINPDGYLQLAVGDIVIRCGENSKRIPGINMYKYVGDYDDEGEFVAEEAFFTGENYVTGAIDAVVTGRTSKVYFLEGHGEKTLENDYSTFYRNLIDQNYGAAQLYLPGMDAVPEDAAIIIVAAPKSDFSNEETRLLNDYLDKGGNVVFMMSPNDDHMRYTNIESILEDYGLILNYDLVSESNKNYFANEDPYTFQVDVVAPNADYGVDLTSELLDMTSSGIYAFMSNTRSFSRYLNPEDTTLKIESLLQTKSTSSSDGSSVVDGMVYEEVYSTAISEPYGGTDDFAEPIEGQVWDLAMYSQSGARNNSKVMAFGTADFIDDDSLTEDYMIIPVDLFLASITWMYNSDLDLDMGISDKEKSYDYLTLGSEAKANMINVLYIAAPVVVGLVGAVVWVKRRYM